MSSRKHGKSRKGSPTAGTSQSQQQQDDELTDPALLAIRYGIKNTLELVEEILSSCPTAGERKSAIKRLQALMLKLIKAEMAYNESSIMIDEIAEEIPDDESLDDKEILASCDKILPIAEERMKSFEGSLTQNNLKKHHSYTQLMKEIAKIEQEADTEEDELGEESILADDTDSEHIPTIDPISKTKLTDPVRNTRCNHIYGHASILQLIRKNPKIKCPTMGCSNKAFVKARDLKTDPKLTALVAKKVAEAERLEAEDN